MKKLFGVLRVLIALALLYYLAHKVNLVSTWDTLKSAHLLWFLLANVAFLAFLLVSNWRWQVLLEARGLRFSYGYLLRVYFVAWMFNNILPTSIGGDVARIAYTTREGKGPIAFAATLMDRIIGFIGLFFFAFVISVVLWFVTHTSWYLVLDLLGFVALVLITLTLFSDAMHRLVVAIFGRIRFLKLGRRIDELYQAVKEFRKVPSALVKSFLSSLAIQVLLALMWCLSARTVGGQVMLLYYCLLIPIIGIITMIPISIGGLGVRENSFVGFFTAERMANHLTQNQALATAALCLAITIVFSLAGGVVFLALKRSGVTARRGSAQLGSGDASLKTEGGT
jgi:hypothetical protein